MLNFSQKLSVGKLINRPSKIFWLNKTQNIRADIGMNLGSSERLIGQKIVLGLLLKWWGSDWDIIVY